MAVVPKIAGGISLLSSLNDIHKTALIYAKDAKAKACGDTYIARSIGTQKANRLSVKDTDRKNWLLRKNFTGSIIEAFETVKGYMIGLFDTSIKYIPNFILQALSMKNFKHKNISYVATCLLGILEGYDFIKNASNIGQRTDYLK